MKAVGFFETTPTIMHLQTNRLLFAMIIIGLGALLLADNFHVITIDLWDWIATYWPVILLYVGLKQILTGLYPAFRGRSVYWGGLFWGIFLLFLGWNFLAPNLNLPHIPWDQVWKLWPLLLIWFGIHILLPSSHTHDQEKESRPGWKNGWWDEEGWKAQEERWRAEEKEWRERRREKYWNQKESEKDRQSHIRRGSTFVLIGEVDQPGETFTLEDTDYQVGIGSIDLNLTQAVLPEREVTLHANGVLGSINLYLPADIPARITGTVQIGNLDLPGVQESGILKRATIQTDGFDEATKRLVIRASQFIGEVRVIRV
ncbi:cell wall-active antibiotics response protein LiaF [Desmospora profundinema]|uniref:Cell wall-active antibiotics response LiaF-like C-terminal domain-containing protein n=1 Tax=Desmospora profundinema TaxID=1571184 RepID=A0ABU1IRA8_9BACL|nr:cell wall-active antibiotics response protein LiaF [Desmospora profundinema]MDR6227323.1 hypothetical protein [Desmospora profundinema]